MTEYSNHDDWRDLPWMPPLSNCLHWCLAFALRPRFLALTLALKPTALALTLQSDALVLALALPPKARNLDLVARFSTWLSSTIACKFLQKTLNQFYCLIIPEMRYGDKQTSVRSLSFINYHSSQWCYALAVALKLTFLALALKPKFLALQP